MDSSSGHYVQFVGDPDDGFTSAEIYEAADARIYLGRIFQLDNGWYVQVEDFERLEDRKFVRSVLEARDELLHFVNRMGGEFPDDATRAAVSLWLMQRDDGKGFTIKNEDE